MSPTDNIVRLPTAASRKVQNFRHAEQRRAVQAKRQAEPWPGEHLHPFQREARKREQELDQSCGDLHRTPEMFVLLCLLQAFPADRLDALENAADAMLAMDPQEQTTRLGYALVSEAVRCRRDEAASAKKPA